MKNKLQKALLLAGILTCLNKTIQAQTPTIQWQRTFGGVTDNSGTGECAYKIMNTATGGYVVCGLTNAPDITGAKGAIDATVVAYDSAGNKLWHKCYGGTSSDAFGNMDITPDGNYIMSGLTVSTNGDVSGNHGAQDIWVVKTNDTGQVLWQKCYGGTGADGLKSATAGSSFREVSVKAVNGGGYILSAPVASNNGDISGNHGLFDVWVARLNDTGAVLWSHCYGGSANDYPNGEIFQTSDGGYVVGATTESSDGDVTGYHGGSGDMWLIKINSVGTLQWQKSLGGSGIDICTGGVLVVDSGYVMTGTSRSADGDVNALGGGTYDWWAVKVNDTGAVQWSKSFGNTGSVTYDWLQGSTVAKDGGLILSGVVTGSVDNSSSGIIYDGIGNGSNIEGPLLGASDGWLIKLTQAGDIAWQKVVGTSSNEQFQNVIQRNDGTITAVGYLTTVNGIVAGSDWWTVHLSACPAYSYITDTICKGSAYAFGSQNLSVAGTYTDTLIMTENGCDSLVTLTLYVDSIIKPTITTNGTLLTTGTYHNYQWLDGNGNFITNATQQNYQPIVNGNYKVVAYNERGCSDTSDAYIFQITSVLEPATLAGLQLYPNPATIQISIDLATNISVGSLSICGLDGKIIKTMPVGSGKQKYTLPVGDLPAGIYFVKITTTEGVAFRKWTKL